MKTSNLLITGLLAITLLFGFTSNQILKKEFDKIDRKDPFSGYRKEALKTFRHVTVQGKILGYTQIQPGKRFQLLTSISPEKISWTLDKDTLKITYKQEAVVNYPAGYNFSAAPTTYIMAPTLSGIRTGNSACKITSWTLDSLSIVQQGEDMELNQNTLGTLAISAEKQASFRMKTTNKINSASVIVKGHSEFTTDNVYKTFQIKADSTARVGLPGGLLKGAGVL